jgi:hypothetical protein
MKKTKLGQELIQALNEAIRDEMAEQYLTKHGRSGGSSLKTLDTFKAGWDAAMEAVRKTLQAEKASEADEN